MHSWLLLHTYALDLFFGWVSINFCGNSSGLLMLILILKFLLVLVVIFFLRLFFAEVCEQAYSMAQNLDPNSDGRGVLQFKTGLMSVIKVFFKLEMLIMDHFNLRHLAKMPHS